jgi:hypothetical protein
MKRSIRILAILGLLAAIGAGCDSEDTNTYDVPITWNIGGGMDCTWSVQGDLVQLDNVTVTVYEEDGDEEIMDGPLSVSCGDFEYTIPRLKRGTYWVKVQAWGEYDGYDLPILMDEMSISAPYKDTHDNDFTLLLSPGDIRVTWSFENGFGCEYNEVSHVDIGLADENVECGPQQHTIEGKPAFSEYSVLVNGLNADNDVIFTGTFQENPFLLLPGDVYDAHVVLEEI